MAGVLAVADHRQGALRDVSFEVVSAGRELADETDGALHVAVICGDATTLGEGLALDGVDVVHAVAHDDGFSHDVYVQALLDLVDVVDPRFVLAPNSINGLDYAPAVADELALPLVTDVVDLAIADGGLVATRERYGGKVEAEIAVDATPAVVTIRAAEWPAASDPGDAPVEAFEATIDADAIGSTVTGYEEVAGGDVDITEADLLVSIGRGIEDEENLDLIRDLADALDATLSSSRPIVDQGWLPADRQVGQSGKVVTPDVYIAIGISGAVQHVAGMKGSDTIVAINTDPNAPIMDVADYAIVDDLFDVVPALIEEFA